MPKLTLRNLYAVVTIVAMALGWWLDRSRLAKADAHLFNRSVASDQEAGAWRAIFDQWEQAVMKLKESGQSDQTSPSE